MDPHLETSYRALIRPIPPNVNLANIHSQPACKSCEHCAVIFPDHSKAKNGTIKIPYERIDLYPDFPALKASAKAGCGLCRMIRKTIRSQWSVRPMEEWGVGPLREKEGLWDELFESLWDRKVKIYKVGFAVARGERDISDSYPNASYPADIDQTNEGNMAISLGFEFGPQTKLLLPDGSGTYGDIGRVVSFKVFDFQNFEPEQKYCVRRLPDPSALSPQNLEMILQWIGNCVAHHPECIGPSLPSPFERWYPTRLLDIGPADGSVLPRLVETDQEEIRGHFAALSHMWGDMLHRPPLQTFKANYEELKTGIQWSELPKNFADAVIVTRRLGLVYIWIDSLCITQDDLADWKKEAATMHDVYRWAYITIVATSATSTHDGFLDRDLYSVPAVKVGYSSESTERHFIISPQDDIESGNWLGDIESCPWNRRGWTMQERGLSTRMLHFCKNKLYFECRNSSKSEENESITQTHLSPERPQLLRPPSLQEQQDVWADSLLRKWTKTVSGYTQRRLTRGSDKLIAIQSMATRLSETLCLTTQYIKFAGMWELNLNRELLWHAKDGPVSKPKEYRAPTWSWASIDAKIGWNELTVPPGPSHYHIFDIHFEILDISNAGSEPQQDNFLKARAYLRPLSAVIECENDDRWVNGTRTMFPYDFFVHSGKIKDDISAFTFQERRKAVDERKFIKLAEGRLDLDDQDSLTRSQRRLYYLHIDRMRRPSGLVIEPVNEKGNFKRVGVAAIFDKVGEPFLEPGTEEREVSMEVILV